MSALRSVNLINPPSAPGTLANREGAAGLGVVYPLPASFFYPPHTLATMAAVLREAGFAVRAHDGVVERETDSWAHADVVAVFVSWATLETDVSYIVGLRRRTEATLMAFGPATRFIAEELLARAPLDVLLIGEAEGFIGKAMHWLASSGKTTGTRSLLPEDVQGTACDGQGLLRDLDSVPFPAWDLLPNARYPLLTVMSSRGCPDQCTYCPYVVAQGCHFRARSVENVLAELEYVAEHFGPSRLVFRDPVFAHDRSRVVRICTDMIGRRLGLQWECESRPEHFDAELLRLMRRAGCQWVKIGLETTSEDLLVQLRRVSSLAQAGAYLRQVADVVQACHEVGVHCRLFVMAGLPGQEGVHAVETSRFLQQVRPNALNVKRCEAYPGVACASATGRGVEGQLQILRQAQQALQSPRVVSARLARVRRWLARAVRRGQSE